MKHIIIIGGGIAGLTAAHELVEQNYKVTLIERNIQVGGLARTYQNEDNKICPYEYSWRGFGPYYQNVYNITKRILYNDKESVFDKLILLNNGKKTCNKKIPSYFNFFKNMNYNDIIKILSIIIPFSISCDERNIQNYSKIGLRHWIKEKKISKYTEDAIGKTVGPYLGFDYHNSSVYDLLYYNEMFENNNIDTKGFKIASLPTSFMWFEPWVKLLKSKGVEIKLNTEVTSIKLNNNNSIESIEIYDKINNKQHLKADYYINCTGPEILEKLLNPYKLNNHVSLFYNNINKVAENGRQIQLSVYYYINKKIFFDHTNTCGYLPNTPWLLMVLPTGHIWGDEYMAKYCNSEIKEVISVGICEPYVKGLYIKKPWSECTPEEIRIETWYQLINDSDFKNNVCIEDGISISELKIIDFKMWDSFIYRDGKIDTYEPKWANNINTIQYRPKSITPISNLFLAGAYTNTTTGIYSMESAVESGKIAAKNLCKYDNKPENIVLINKKRNIFSYPIRYIDNLIYKQQYINIVIHILLLVILLFICNYIFTKLKIFIKFGANSIYKVRRRRL